MNIRFVLLFFLMVLASPATEAQVHRAESGLGSALILPYWTAAINNDTLLSIRNDSDDASAAKVRILDDEGVLLQSFNLYLDAHAVWTSGFSLFDDVSGLLLREGGCVLPADIASESEFSAPMIPLDSLRGSIEVIEMARATNESDLAESGQWADCDVLAEEFDTGDWSDTPNAGLASPGQQLSASASVINVPVGGMNVIAATALAGFSDVAQHTAPDVVVPDLAHAFDSQSPEGGTRSLVCAPSGCRIDEWDLPIEAVAAVLTVSSLRVDYSVRKSIGAKFDWMVHRPLERYEEDGSGFAIDLPPTITIRKRDGVLPDTGNICIPEQPPGSLPCGQNSDFPLDRGIVQQNLAFNADPEDEGGVIESAVLGHPTVVRPGFAVADWAASEFHEGTAEFRFIPDDDDVQLLVASDGTVFAGEPVVSFAVQQYTNGMLTDAQGQNVLANYRGTELPRRVLQLETLD